MIKASQLAKSSQEVIRLIGDEELTVSGPTTLPDIRDGALAWVKLGASEETLQALERVPARAVVVCGPNVVGRLEANPSLTLLVTKDPRLTVIRLVAKFFPLPSRPVGAHPLAHIEPGARIDPQASIAPFCYISGECEIGAGSVLHPHVVLYAKVRIGRNVVIHSGTTLGADGFGYERNERGELERFPHLGGVVIEDDVEIGSNSNIDRGALGDTIVRRGCKIDNQVHVGHNAVLGEHVAVTAHSLIGGSVVVGDGAYIAPSSVVMNQVLVGANAMVGMGSVVVRDVADGGTVMGVPAVPDQEFKRTRAAVKAMVSKDQNS